MYSEIIFLVICKEICVDFFINTRVEDGGPIVMEDPFCALHAIGFSYFVRYRYLLAKVGSL